MGVETYAFAVLLILAIVCVYFTYKLFRITHLRSWLLAVLGIGFLVAWRLLVLTSLISALLLISNVFLLFILGLLTLGLWQLKRKFSKIYRHVNEAN